MTRSSLGYRASRSNRSAALMPMRAALSVYAGPMPLPVVPIAWSPPGPLGQLVQHHVIRHHEVTPVADQEPAVQVHAPVTQPMDLLEKGIRVHDYAVANDCHPVGPEDPGWHQVELEMSPPGS